MVTDTNDQRLTALEHRTDGLEQDIRDERRRLDGMVKDVSYVRGAITEMRWVMRVMLGLLVVSFAGQVVLYDRIGRVETQSAINTSLLRQVTDALPPE